MLLYAGASLNKWAEASSPTRRASLFLMSGEMPSSMAELRGKMAVDLFDESVAALEVISRASGRFTHYIHDRVMKNPHMFCGDKLPAKDAFWIGNRAGYNDQRIDPEYNLSQHYSRLLKDLNSVSSAEYQFGSNSGSYFEMAFQMEKPVHATKLHVHFTFSTGSTFYGNYFAGRAKASDFNQLDGTLDLSGATNGQTVRIRNAADLPEVLKKLEGVVNLSQCRFADDAWEVVGVHDSHDWIPMNKDRISLSRETEFTFDHVDYKDSTEKFEIYKFKPESSSSVNFRGRYHGFSVSADDLPNFDELPASDITWGIIIPNFDDSLQNGALNHKSSVSGDAPMFMFDVGMPNEGAAATVNYAKAVTPTTNITLMNLKVAVNWMEELA